MHFLLLVQVLLTLVSAAYASNTTGLLSISPSLYWDGVDGSWSTFQIQVGTPGQTVRLLPGTSANAGNSFWVVIPDGCSTAASPGVSNCANERGYVFTSNKSSTWSTQRLSNGGLYQLDTFEEGQLGLTGNAYYGFDTVTLGLDGSGLPTLTSQIIAGYATSAFWLGSLGLSPIAFNFTSLDDPLPSMLSTLRNQSTIASTSWAYTAGASYQDPPVYGSLTLGGYDNARFNASNALTNVSFGADFSRDLVIGIQSITYNTLGSSPLLTEGIYAFIDSMVTQMYLPVSVCQAFEQAFNLTWNATAELYLLTSEQHNNLLAQDPTLTLTLSPLTSAGSQTIDISMPYSAFDLNISQPFVDETTYYFPLKQAQNETQYTLGRVFLQEAYVIADYDRQQFHVAQALFPGTEASQQLQMLEPPVIASSNNSREGSGGGLSTGAIVGIVIGAVVLVALVATGVLLHIRRRKRRSLKTAQQHQQDGDASAYSDDKKEGISELAPNRTDPYAEMGVEGSAVHEMGGQPSLPSELASKTGGASHELPGERVAVEKDGDVKVSELEGTLTEPVELEAP